MFVRTFLILAFLSAFAPLFASEWDSFTHFPPIDIPYHPVSTSSKEAQQAFDKGLVAIYAFNYDEAVRSFDKASQLDPHLAMAYWGLALALDENLDSTSTAVHARLTLSMCQKAVALSQNATPKEQAYIQALSQRFSSDPKADRNALRKAYAQAMQKLVESYPDDLDATTLYAESQMDLLFWDLWKSNTTPKTGTLEIIHLLESVLKRDPLHLGANHYYIHALENSPYPERGLMSAYRLDSLNLPEWGHLIHTSSHIYLHVGSYELAVNANKKAIAADKNYIQVYGLEGRYPLKYFSHNLFFLTMAYLLQERFDEAKHTVSELEELIRPFVSTVSSLEFNLFMPLEVYLYFHRWEEILHYPEPPKKFKSAKLFWSFARAMAYASTAQLERAQDEGELFLQQKNDLFGKSAATDFSRQFFELAENVLAATFTRAKGDLQNSTPFLDKAIEIQAELGDFIWYNQISQTLGATLIDLKRFEEAEKVFREALDHLPRNGRSLFGLAQALHLQGKNDYSIERSCNEALRYTKQQLTLKDLY